MTIFLLLLLLILVYWMYSNHTSQPRQGSCSTGSCGSCSRCKAEQFRFRRHKAGCDCNLCEGFRFREASKYPKKEVKMTTDLPSNLASVNNYNNGLPFYFDAYGSELSMIPGQGDPGAVAPHAQYTDLYEAGQTLHNKYGPFQTTNQYQFGGATSDLNMAVEELQNLQNELTRL